MTIDEFSQIGFHHTETVRDLQKIIYKKYFDTVQPSVLCVRLNGAVTFIVTIGVRGGITSFADQPSFIEFIDTREQMLKAWVKNGEFHRITGPALLCKNQGLFGCEEKAIWMVHGQRIGSVNEFMNSLLDHEREQGLITILKDYDRIK